MTVVLGNALCMLPYFDELLYLERIIRMTALVVVIVHRTLAVFFFCGFIKFVQFDVGYY